MTFPDIRILRTRHLRGPSIWTYRPVIEAWVDIGPLEDHPSNTLPGFNDRLKALLPGLIEHRCGIGERGGFLMRLDDGTWPGHIMEHVAIELQNLAGIQVGFGKARETSQRGVYKVVIRTRQAEVGLAALEAARDIVMACIRGHAVDLAAVVTQLTDKVDRLCLGPSTACIVDAATDRRIPYIRLTDGNLVQLGHGARQRRIWTAETDKTSAIAESISSDKDLTKRLLSQCGVPVPRGEVVKSPEEAWAVAQDLGLPVVVKPSDANHGRGVALDLRLEADIRAAFEVADREGSEVMVEQFIQGEEHRLLVVGDRVVAAAKGEMAEIVGDGQHTVEQLIELQINADPRRGEEEDFPLDTIRLAEHHHAVLEIERQGYRPDSIPEVGRRVIVQRNGNMNHDVTDLVHPEVAALVGLAARVVGLDIAGIDLVAQDISRPLDEQGGAIVEVNAGPGLLMHLKPEHGNPRPVGQAIVDHLFKHHDDGRIPVVGVMGSQSTSQLAQLIAWLLHLNGAYTGLVCQNGMFVNDARIRSGDMTSFDDAQSLLINRSIEAAVFETKPIHILNDGLPYDRCRVSVLTDACTLEGLESHDILNAEQLRSVVRTHIDVVLPEGAAVLNADDEAVVGLADLCDGEVIFYSPNPLNAALTQHRQQGRRVVTIEDQHVVMARGDQRTELFSLGMAPIARLIKHEQVALPTLLAASACAWSLDISPALIRAGLKNFGKHPLRIARKVARVNA
jgi:cyanophycin synthetase